MSVQNKKKEEMEMVNKNGVVVDFKTGVEKSSEGDLTGIENNMNSVCSGMLSESKFNDVGKPGTNELTSVCRGNKTVLVDDNIAIKEQGRNHGAVQLFHF
ncbi:hypothetical protein OIU85_008818 [Salix viminalis]|uniref:Uncharacterized protein n=1 Tax=Salix viminalis TaxID=40686 RepID=A0A9Q0NYK3_SALVM|nr:hypothetical protein OIU85_008818 [Salix viminalis]